VKQLHMGSDKGKKWGALRLAWKGYKIARARISSGEGTAKDKKDMVYYSEGIHRMRQELGLGKAKVMPKGKKLPMYINGTMHKTGETKKIVIEGFFH